jgi:hypothetical protein
MKIANITPIPLLDKVLDDLETYHLVLTSLMNESEAYRQFYQRRIARGDYVILDNDAFELGESLPVDAIGDAALEFHPSEVVLPDKYDGTCAETLGMARSGLHLLKRRFEAHNYCPKFFGVVHGETWEKWVECALGLWQMGVDTLGVNEEVEELYGLHRCEVVKQLNEYLCEWHAHGTQIHLLGKLEDLSDLVDPFVQKVVRGCDSGKLIRWGFDREIAVPHHVPPYPGRGEDFFQRDTDDAYELSAIRTNIQLWRNIAAGVDANYDSCMRMHHLYNGHEYERAV